MNFNYKALIDATKSMHNPPLDSEANTGKFGYKYASLSSVLGIVRGALLEQGLVLTQGIVSDEQGIMWLTTAITDEEGNQFTADSRRIYENQNAQQFGSYETYMRRYALCSAFGLVGEDDDDGAKTTEPKQAEKLHANAKEAGEILGDAITVYCAATGADPAGVRKTIKDKLERNNEGGNPEALKREAAQLHTAVKALGNV